MIENDTWAILPLPPGFSPTEITELGSFIDECKYSTTNESFIKNDIFESYEKIGNPFSKDNNMHLLQKEETSSNLTDEPAEDTNFGDDAQVPIVATPTINLVKLIGRYLKMMRTLSNISWQVFNGMIEV